MEIRDNLNVLCISGIYLLGVLRICDKYLSRRIIIHRFSTSFYATSTILLDNFSFLPFIPELRYHHEIRLVSNYLFPRAMCEFWLTICIEEFMPLNF